MTRKAFLIWVAMPLKLKLLSLVYPNFVFFASKLIDENIEFNK